MTEQDKLEIRQIIREELDARLGTVATASYPAGSVPIGAVFPVAGPVGVDFSQIGHGYNPPQTVKLAPQT